MSDEVLKTFVEIWYPGSFMPEQSEEEVAERDPKKVAAKHKNCFSFQFYDQYVKNVFVDGKMNTVRGPKRNLSSKYFPGGRLFTADELRVERGDYKILISNMECNGWPQVVRCRTGNFQPFGKDCELVKVKP